jgi:hypothetical protein
MLKMTKLFNYFGFPALQVSTVMVYAADKLFGGIILRQKGGCQQKQITFIAKWLHLHVMLN